MDVGLLVIGDEILSGKRQDKHLPKVIGLLQARGIALAWAQFLGDDEEQIAAAIAAARARGDVLLACGGIGATPDDCTRQAAARGLGVPVERHQGAEALIINQYADAAFPNRVLMADFPAGAELIPNPVNRVAGFHVGDCYFVPGFPEMAWPMLEWVLDERLRHLHSSEPPVEYSLRAIGPVTEGDLLPLMRATLDHYPEIKLSSLPFRGNSERPRHIEFGFKGTAVVAAAAYASFQEGLRAWPTMRVEELKRPI
ncbi:MAG TPA: molybdopterin-binding protein [Solimonas sp.]|nr:molybdopterin-binding protein [Solimonas sp.]